MNGFLGKTCRTLLHLLAYAVCTIWPPSKKHVVFGSWLGTLFADNPKYLLLYLANKQDLHLHWIGKSSIEETIPKLPNVDFSTSRTPKAWFNILRSRYMVCSHAHFFDLTSLPLFHGRHCLNLWHGTPIKYLGKGLAEHQAREREKIGWLDRFCRFLAKPRSISTPVSSARMGELLAMQNENNFGNFLPFGTPRNDFLLNNRDNVELQRNLREKYARLLGFDPRRKIVLYLPTYRSSGKDVFAFYDLKEPETTAFVKILDDNNAVLIEKHHWMTYVQHPLPPTPSFSIVIPGDRQNSVDTQELLFIADILVSDYSGAYIDFGLLGRPCIHFVYDLDEYRDRDSGLAYDLNQVAAGPIVKTLPDLLETLAELLARPVFNPAPRYHEIVEYEKGHSCEQLARFMGLKTHE